MDILVGMSGGVDSSVAAFLLKEQGHNVIGATMAIWGERGVYKKLKEKSKNVHGACFGPDEKEDIEAARKICKQINIPFYVLDCAEQYEEIVLKNFRQEYLNGRTPNPCIWCNSLIKFDILPNLAKINGIKFDKFATGHYVKIEEQNDRFLLKRAMDFKKDQSYFLYRLKQKQLKNIIFPLGNYTKEEIRQIAKKYKLETANKPDSQDFYEGNYNELLLINDKIGNIVDKNGKILGIHNGIWNYTIGQRKGLKISSDKPLYVVDLKKDTNEVVVDFKNNAMKNKLIAIKTNWIAFEKLENKINCMVKIRSSQDFQEAVIEPFEKNCVKVEFLNMQNSISKGQSVVFYKNDIVLGGGIIDEIL